ncbi:ankyrin repeat domain-containing protein 22 [Salvelinus fontinalis]|uniref:ankyrin repeat domain-containing protein 22 n=1 Tax=Salvelinus fontinalis TaxID=8038 RepID=UPI0024862029|nr:ankyrin repeat domain-containing protein 22 [Salvelinus fontinalis]
MGIVYSEPICQAAYDNDLQKVYHILKEDAKTLNVQDEESGDTPIIAACRCGNIRMVKYLLDLKADVVIRNKKQRTCLHYVAKRTFSFLDYLMITILMPILLIGYFILEDKQRKNVKLMNLVLSTKVEVDAVDYQGNTGLHYVCQMKSHRLVPLLLEKKADVSIKNKDDETPLDIARRLQFKNIVTMLKKPD